MQRTYSLKIYFTDSPTPYYAKNVEHIQTEGMLLRLIIDGKSNWYPLTQIARIQELSKSEGPAETPIDGEEKQKIENLVDQLQGEE